MKQNFLNKLPHEVLTYTFKFYLDLPDLWHLTQVSKDIRTIAKHIIERQWRIELNPSIPLLKIKTHAVMVFLIYFSQKLIQRIKVYDPYAFPPFVSLSQQQQKEVEALHNNNRGSSLDSTVYDLAIPLTTTTTSPLLLPRYDNLLLPRALDVTASGDDESYIPANSLFPPTIEPGLDDDMTNDIGFAIERFKYQSKRLKNVLDVERKLHERVAKGITDDHLAHNKSITSPLRCVLDVIFYHAVFVRSWDRVIHDHDYDDNSLSFERHRLEQKGSARCLAAACARLVCALEIHFEGCERMIYMALWENMESFMSLTEYRLLAVKRQQPELLKQLQESQDRPRTLLPIVYSIGAMLDLLGACYVAHLVSDEHALLVVRKVCTVLDNVQLSSLKSSMLSELINIWLSMDEFNASSSLRFVIEDEV
ncbi:MAG: hypothetical protein EXX96DRAFT_564896 [Benjaminiella poitrasii]|nr:MAG: hypothetical protein EXX96DRAFT_564896 [Benjaminiella poitrasii]